MKEEEINEIFLRSVLRVWAKQDYLRGFNSKSETYQEYINLFKSMEISKYIYKVVMDKPSKIP